MRQLATLFSGHLFKTRALLRNPPYPNTEPGCLHRWPYSARVAAVASGSFDLTSSGAYLPFEREEDPCGGSS